MSFSFDPDRIEMPIGHHIGGAFVAAQGEVPIHRPSDNVAFADCPVADADVVDRAVQAAKAALRQSHWGGCQPRDRTHALQRWADLIEADAEVLGQLESVPSTRPVAQIKNGDIAVTAEQIRFFAEMADKEGSLLAPTRDDQMGWVASEPYGVVGAITPWNFPISMAGWKLAPALAAGNAVVLKPSEMTPFSALRMAELAVKAGIPEGLINIVQGDGATTGNALTGHPEIAKLSFTGSTVAGQAIMGNIARTGMKPMTLELGGKSPQIVFADADLDKTAQAIATSILANSGQACVAGSRVIVAAKLAEALVDRVQALLANINPGPTWDGDTTYGPIISEKQLNRVDSLVQASLTDGATVLCGGKRLDRPGCFYTPTILTDVSSKSPAVTEEIFGPVLTIQTFLSEEEALQLAAHATYGLAAGVFTRDLSRAIRVVKALEAGTVWVNRYGRSRDHILPTGGYKSSGIGKDLGREAYHANRRSKSVLIDL
jgi:aldehyde dehydrogenase (NAD+)